MNKKYTIEVVSEIFKLKGYILLSNIYNNLDEKLTFKDSDGYYYEMSFYNFYHQKHKPQKFNPNNSYTLKNINLLLKLKDLNLYVTDTNYINGNQKLTLMDNLGYYYQTTVNGLLDNNAPVLFDTRNNYTLYNIKLWLKNNKPKFELISEKYNGNKCKIILKDSNGYYYESFINNLIKNYEPERFAKSNSYTIQNINLWLKETNNKDFILISDKYYDSESKLKWKCLRDKCNKVFEMSWTCIQSGKGCPKCVESKGEKEVDMILNKYGIYNIFHYTFPNCKYINVLAFDFYLPKYNICIEYQGQQHYEPIDFAGKGQEWAEKEFKLNQKRDEIKRKFCKKNNIKLIEIPYWDFNNVEQILIKELNLTENKLIAI